MDRVMSSGARNAHSLKVGRDAQFVDPPAKPEYPPLQLRHYLPTLREASEGSRKIAIT